MDNHHQKFHLNRIGPPATKSGVANIMDFDKVTSLIGRNKGQVDFVLDSSNLIASQYISRLHGRIVRQENNSHRLFDDSLNGIFINNTKIMGSVVLQEGDIVTFGHPCGVKLKPGVWARQPDSEYQFIFERCSCPPSGKHVSGKPAVLEDRINTHHSQTPVFKKPLAGAVKPSLSDKDNCDKISSMFHQDQTMKPSLISSADQSNQSCYKLTDQSGQLHTNMTLPVMPDKHSGTSVNLTNSSSPRPADQSDKNKTGDASPSGHSANISTPSTLLKKDKTDIPDQVSDNQALAEARQIIDKCMTTIAGMSATLTGSPGFSERCASMPNAALCSTSSCQVKENGESGRYMSEINSNHKSSENSTTSIVLSGRDVGEKQYSLNESMDVSSTNMLPNLSNDGNNSCEEHMIEADETNELPICSETAELPAEVGVKNSTPLLTDSSTLYTESPSASPSQLPSSPSSPLSRVSATSPIFPPSTLLSSVTSTEPLSSPATVSTSLTSNVPSCTSSFILGQGSSSLLSPSVQSVSSSTYSPSVRTILSPELTLGSKELLKSFHQELFDDQSNLPSASLTQPLCSSLKLRTSLNTNITTKSPSYTTPSPSAQHISLQPIQSVPLITSSSSVSKVSSSPDLSLNSIEILDSFPQELPVMVDDDDSSVERSSLISSTPSSSSTTQSIPSPHYGNSVSAPQLSSNNKEMEGGDNSLHQELHVDQTDSSCSQSIEVAAQSSIHSRKNKNVGNDEVVSEPPVPDDKGEKSAEMATPSTSSSVRNEIIDTNSNTPSTSSGINCSISMEGGANFPIVHDNGNVKSTPKKGKNVSRKQKESPSVVASPSYIGCMTRGRKRKQKQLCPCCNHPPKNAKSSQNSIVESPITKSPSTTSMNSKSKRKSSSRKNKKNSDNGLDASLLGTVQPDPDVVYLLSESHGVICISDDEEDVPLSKITERGKNDSPSVESNGVCIELDVNAPSSSNADNVDSGNASQTGKETPASFSGSQVDNNNLEQVNCDILQEQNGNDVTNDAVNDVLPQENITTIHHVNDKTPEVGMQFEDASQGTKNDDDKVSKEIANGESKRDPIMAVHEEMLSLQSNTALQSPQKHNIELKMEVGGDRRDPSPRRNDDYLTSQVRIKDDDIKDESDEIEMQQMKSECVTSKGEIDDVTSLTRSGNRNYIFKEEDDIKPQEEELVNTKLESDDIAPAKNDVTSGEEDSVEPKLESDGTSQIKIDVSPKEEEDDIYDYYDDYSMPNVESEDDGDLVPEGDYSVIHEVRGDPDPNDESVTHLVKDEAKYEDGYDGMSQSDDGVSSRQVEGDENGVEGVDVQPLLEKNNGFKVQLQNNGYATAQILANDVPAQIQNDDVTAEIQNDDVTAEIQDDDVTAEIQDDDVTAQIQDDDDVTTQIQDDDVTAQIQDDDDVTTQMQDDDVTAQIQDDDDATAQIQDDDVTAQIQDDDDVTAQIQDDDVDDVTAEIQDDDFTAQIQDGDDVTAQIQDDDDVTAQIQDDDDTAQIQDDDDVTAQIQDDDDTAQIQDDDDATAQIQDDDVTAQIQDDDDATAQIQDDDDTAQIQDDDDVTAQIQDDDITAQIQEDDDYATAQIECDDDRLEDNVLVQIQNVDVTTEIHIDDVTSQLGHDDNQMEVKNDDVTAQMQDDVIAQIQNGDNDDLKAEIYNDDVTPQIQNDDVTAPIQFDDVTAEMQNDDVTAKVQDDDVTAEIQNDDVTAEIQDDDVTAEIQNDDVTAEIQDDDVTAEVQDDDVTAEVQDDDVTAEVQDDDVTAEIQDDDVTAEIQNDDVTAEIQDDDVTAKIQNDDVTAEIQNDDVTAEIQNDDVTAEVQDDDVTAKIQNDDVTAEIQNDDVTAEIQDDDVTAEIQNDDVTAEVQNDDVTAEIQDDDVTAEIQNDDVTAEIQNDDVTAEIQNDDVTAELQDDDVTAEIQNDDVAAEIQDDDVTAEIQDDDVTAEIQNDDVTAEVQDDDVTAQIQDDDVTAEIQSDDATGHDGVTFPVDCDSTTVVEGNVDSHQVKRNVAPYQRDNATFQGNNDDSALELEDKTVEIGIDVHLPYDLPQTHNVFTSSKVNNDEYANEGERSDPNLKGPANEKVKDLENTTTMAKSDENCFSNVTCSVDHKDTSFFTSTPNDCSLSKGFGIGLQEHPLSSVVDDSFSTVKDFSSTSEVQTDVDDTIRDESFLNVEESNNLEFEKNSITPKSNDVLENSEIEMDELGSHDVELEREDKNKVGSLSGRRHETSDNEVAILGSQDVDAASEVIGYGNEIDDGGFRRREELEEVVTVPQGVSFLEHGVDELKSSELNDVKLVKRNDQIEDAESTSQDLQSEEDLANFEKLKEHSLALEKTEDVKQERSESSDVESEEEGHTWLYSEFGYEDGEKIEIPEPHGLDFGQKEDEIDVLETQEIKSDEAALKENCVFEVWAEEELTNGITISGHDKVDDEVKISPGSNNLELGRDGGEHVFSTQIDRETAKEKNEPQKDLSSHKIDLPVLKMTFENKEEGYEVALGNEIFDDEVSQSPCAEWGRGENKDFPEIVPQNLGLEKEDGESETCISELHKNILVDDRSEGLTSLPKVRLELENGLDMDGASKTEADNKENMASDVTESQESGSEQRNEIETSKPQECWPESRDEIENSEEINSNDQATWKGASEIIEKTENELLRSELQNESINEIEKFKENLNEEIEVEQEDHVLSVKRQRSVDDIDVEDHDCPAEKKNKFDINSKDLAGEIPAFPLAASFSDGEEDSDFDFELFPALHPSSTTTTTISRKRKTLDGILPSEPIQYDVDGLSDLPKRNKLSTDTDDNGGVVSWTPIVPVSADLSPPLSSPVTLKQSDESSTTLSQSRLALICNDASSSMADNDNDKESSDCILNDNDDRQARAMSPLIGNQSLLTDDIYSLTPGLISYSDSEPSKDPQSSDHFVELAVGEGGPETELTPLATTRATDSPDNDNDRPQSNDEMESSKIDSSTLKTSSVCSTSTSGSGDTGSHYVSCIPSPAKLLTLSSGAVEEEDAPISLERRREKREKLHAAVVLELQRINKDIKTFLSKDNPNLDQAVSVLEDLQDIPINSAVLAKFPSILETLNKCRKYKRSEDVRQVSHEIYNRFKALLL